MSMAIEKYLDRVMIYADRPEPEAAQVRAELRDHLLAKTEQLKEQGMAAEDAVFHAIEDHGHPRNIGYGLRPKWQWIDVRTVGTARGFIAAGPKAVGVFAFGGLAIGVVPVGGLALGLFPMGGLVLALLAGWGGLCVAPIGIAYGGVAIGMIAMGGVAIGTVAAGGVAIGMLAEGGAKITQYTLETAPAWMRSLAELVPSQPRMMSLTTLIMLVFFPALAFGMILQWRETARIHRLDPRLAE